jgi:hypothetical protein
VNGDRSDPRGFWERGRGYVPGTGAPADAPARVPAPPTAPRAPFAPVRAAAAPSHAPPASAPRPSGPPARVGGAVAALVVALLTVIVPVLGVSLGLWFFFLVTNVPGIVLGIMALVKVPDAVEVERYIRYTWACTLAYLVLSVVFLVPVIALAVLFLLMGL